MRLTNYMRQQIRNVLIERTFGERIKGLEALNKAWNQSVQDFLLPADLKAKMATLPARSFPVDDNARIQINSDTIYVHWDKPVEMPYDMYRQGVTKIPATHLLAIEHHQLQMMEKNLDEQKLEARSAMMAALNAVTTTGAFVKRWPEIEPFLSTITGEAQSKALALSIPELNRKLGLAGNPLPAAKPLKTARVKRRSNKT